MPLRDAGPRRASFRLWQEAELERELGEKLGHLKTVNLGCDVTWDGVRGGEKSGVQGTHVVGTVLAGAARVSVPAGRPRLLIRKLPHQAEAEQFYLWSEPPGSFALPTIMGTICTSRRALSG